MEAKPLAKDMTMYRSVIFISLAALFSFAVGAAEAHPDGEGGAALPANAVFSTLPPHLPQVSVVADAIAALINADVVLTGTNQRLRFWLNQLDKLTDAEDLYKTRLKRAIEDRIVANAWGRLDCNFAQVNYALLGRWYGDKRLEDSLMEVCPGQFADRAKLRFKAKRLYLRQLPDDLLVMLVPLDIHPSFRKELVARLRALSWQATLGRDGMRKRAVKACQVLVTLTLSVVQSDLDACSWAAEVAKRMGYTQLQRELLNVHAQGTNKLTEVHPGANVLFK
jgi:hypothetical protein